VELLVVIGIIALLIAILLPSLANARRSAQRVACGVKLQQIMVAANIHATEHHGYYPLCGLLPYVDPAGLGDRNEQLYDYGRYDFAVDNDVLAPITFALARYMGYKSILLLPDNPSIAKAETDPKGMIRNFVCPGQGDSPADFYKDPPILHFGYGSPGGGIDYGNAQESLSYDFNEQVLGFDDALGRLRGKSTAVRLPSKTMFACDGLPSTTSNSKSQRKSSFNPDQSWDMATMYVNYNAAPISLGDAFSGRVVGPEYVAGDQASFDPIRHRGKINIAFCDGHVETRSLSTKDLQNVYLTAP
jgi:prepilin-type processing-associated H-X9-DG protein